MKTPVRFFLVILVALCALAALSGCSGAPPDEDELVATEGEALSSKSCQPSPAPVPAGYFRGACITTGSKLQITTCTCYPDTPSNPTVALDWSMPDKLVLNPNGDGILDISPPSSPPGTPPAINSFAEPSSWEVILNACGSTPAPSYSWSVAGLPAIPKTTSCSTAITVPKEGDFQATVTANYTNEARSLTKTITVKNYVIVSIGDSIASGEGNPEVDATWTTVKDTFLGVCVGWEYDPFHPLRAPTCESKTWVDSNPVWENQSCHRSDKSGPAQAALMLEQSDPHTSVTFISEACSGASILEPSGVAPGNGGLLDPYMGEEPLANKGTWAPQIAAVARALCPASAKAPTTTSSQTWVNPVKSQCRPIDALLITAGANDAGFGAAAVGCSVPGVDCTTNGPISQAVIDEVNTLPGHLAALGPEIQNALNVKNVYFAEYHDPLHDQNGKLCSSIRLPNAIKDAVDASVTGNVIKGYFERAYVNLGLDLSNDDDGFIPGDAVQWLETNVVSKMNADVAAATKANNWIPVTGIAQDFKTHGYCSTDPWVVQYQQSVQNQVNSSGTFHPNGQGHQDYAQHILTALEQNLVKGASPIMTTQPASAAVSFSSTVHFSIAVGSTCGATTTQWQFNGTNLTDGTGISGSQTNSLTLTGVTPAQDGSYRALVTCVDGAGMALSNAATLTVAPSGKPPVITTQPQAVSIYANSEADFSVAYTSTCGAVTTQWMFNGMPLYNNSQVSGSATTALKIVSATTAQTGTITALLTCVNGAGSTTSAPVALTVTLGAAPYIEQQPASVVTHAGSNVTFIVYTQTSCGPLQVQWLFNGLPLSDGPTISGSATNTLKLNNVTAAELGSYQAMLTCVDGAGDTTSDPATLAFDGTREVAFAWSDLYSQTASRAADTAYSYDSGGGSIILNRLGLGQYRVDFPNIGDSILGNVQVSAYGYAGERCKVEQWGSAGTTLQAWVNCFAATGAAIDSNFTVSYLRRTDSPGPEAAYLWAYDKSSASYSPTAAGSSFLWSSSGGAISVTHSPGTGNYTVYLAGQDLGGGTVQVTAYGSDNAYCKVGSWGSGIDVECFDGTTGQPTESMFDLVFSSKSPNGTPSYTYVWADNSSTASYTPSPSYELGSVDTPCAGSSVQPGATIARSSTGHYAVTFPGMEMTSSAPTYVKVTGYGYESDTCEVTQWEGEGNDATADILCTTSNGTPTDATYTVTFDSFASTATCN